MWTGREAFGEAYLTDLLRRFAGVPVRDMAYTLLFATIRILRLALEAERNARGGYKLLPLTGGGAKNPTLVEIARSELGAAAVQVARAGSLAPSAHEPVAMAIIAARTLARLPCSLPAVTGAREAAVLGHIHWPNPATPSRAAKRRRARAGER
jgi:anhydro-N-acetylmuramic acid kinase